MQVTPNRGQITNCNNTSVIPQSPLADSLPGHETTVPSVGGASKPSLTVKPFHSLPFDVHLHPPFIMCRFAPMGDLRTLLADIEDTITTAHQLTIAQQVCSGMEALAAGGHIHRDLATRNVLVFRYDEADHTLTSVKVCLFPTNVGPSDPINAPLAVFT
jgi:serine/threonine protein kinase